MKTLTIVFLVLALGAAALLLTLASDGGGRSARGPIPAADAEPTAPVAEPDEPPRVSPAYELHSSGDELPSAAAEPGRRAVRSEAPPPVRAIFEGTLIAEGAPLAGASVQILRNGELHAGAQTDARGRFRLETSPLTSTGTLRYSARGFVASERRLEAKPNGGTTLFGNVRLVRGQRLTGRVIDGRGIGIADAEVRAEPAGPSQDVLFAEGRSQADGRFEISDAPPGTLSVRARARGFGEVSVLYTSAEMPLQIQLEPGVELRLLLSAPDGEPVAGAEVAIQTQNDPRSVKRVAQSDAEGRVLFDGLSSLLWTVRVTHPDYRPTGRSQVQAGGNEERIECLPWPAIEGVVVAPGSAPAPEGTRVHAVPASTPGDGFGHMDGGQPVGADGRFRLGGLRAGEWRVRATAPGFAPSTSESVRLGIDGDGHAGTIVLQAGSKLVLALNLDGKPVADAEVELFPMAPTPAQLWALASSRGAGIGRRVTSGPDGRATLDNLASGAVWVAVYAQGCPPVKAGPLQVHAGSEPAPIPVELERGARIKGRIVSRAGPPVAGAQLRIVDLGGALGFPMPLVSDENGRYTSEWLPPGRYSLEAFAPKDPTRSTGRTEVEIEAGEQRSLDLTL